MSRKHHFSPILMTLPLSSLYNFEQSNQSMINGCHNTSFPIILTSKKQQPFCYVLPIPYFQNQLSDRKIRVIAH